MCLISSILELEKVAVAEMNYKIGEYYQQWWQLVRVDATAC